MTSKFISLAKQSNKENVVDIPLDRSKEYSKEDLKKILLAKDFKKLFGNKYYASKENNIPRTRSMFFELNPYRNEVFPIFTIKDEDHYVESEDFTFLSLKKIYLAYDHIPGAEYEFAKEVFGSWTLWNKLATKSQLRSYVKEWRDELEIKLRSKAIKSIISASLADPLKGLPAARYLADKGYIPSEKNSKGRPSKEEVERQLKIEAGIHAEVEGDLQRLGLLN